MDAMHRGPLGGMIVICVESGTEVLSEDGSVAVVDDNHTVISGKGALYVTPRIHALLMEHTTPKPAAHAGQIRRKE